MANQFLNSLNFSRRYVDESSGRNKKQLGHALAAAVMVVNNFPPNKGGQGVIHLPRGYKIHHFPVALHPKLFILDDVFAWEIPADTGVALTMGWVEGSDAKLQDAQQFIFDLGSGWFDAVQAQIARDHGIEALAKFRAALGFNVPKSAMDLAAFASPAK